MSTRTQTKKRVLTNGSNLATVSKKKEGDISDSFASLCGAEKPPLPPRFLHLKKILVEGREEQVTASWNRLLGRLKVENDMVASKGPNVVPSIQFSELEARPAEFDEEVRKRGVAVIRGVIPEEEARAYKAEVEEYIKRNPSTKAFPQHDPQVYELYWSAAQLKARCHPNLLKASKALMGLWHTTGAASEISLSQPLSYADRLRIRQPGDASFALGPHVDGGSVERWELDGYGRGNVYNKIFEGDWESYDAWDASVRVPAVIDNYNGLGACSMFRMFQGWISMSYTHPFGGTLMVNPLLQLATTYTLLRPFFQPMKACDACSTADEYLSEKNWEFCGQNAMTSELQGATPGHGMELNTVLHPHLELDRTMVHVPDIKPGDFVIWHCDTIHAVDKVHAGKTDSSVLYIPVCPVTKKNAEYLKRQRAAFSAGTPGPDFPGGKGESEHVGRPTPAYLLSRATPLGLRAAGLQQLVPSENDDIGAIRVIEQTNKILGF